MEARQRNKGFTLIEVVSATACFSVLSLLLALAVPAYISHVATLQLRQAAILIASDIERLQQRSMVSTRVATEYLQMADDLKSYRLYRNGKLRKRVTFAKLGFPKISFSGGNLRRVDFSNEGAPATTGSMKLVHQDRPQVELYIEVQPVTGRVVLHEY